MQGDIRFSGTDYSDNIATVKKFGAQELNLKKSNPFVFIYTGSE